MGEFEREIRKALSKIPRQAINNLRARLLRQWTKVKEILAIFPEPAIRKYPSLYFFGVLAKDWPGLAEATMGIFAELGWNIETSWGVAFEYEGEKIAMQIFGIELRDEGHLAFFLKQEEELREKLCRVCYKGWRKRILLAQGAKKLERFEEVMELLKQKGKIAFMLAEEVTAFFNATEESYLEGHSSEYIANLIFAKYELINKVRSTAGKPQIEAGHFIYKGKKLTGMTLAAYERDFSLVSALNVLREIIPSYNIAYNRENVTDDGILVCRIEVDGLHPIGKIEKLLGKKIITQKFDRLIVRETFGGFEHYARAIIPQLIKEYKDSKIPQVYLSPEFTSADFVQFKLIITKAFAPREWVTKCISELGKKEGITVVSQANPIKYENVEVNIFDLRVDRTCFNTSEDIYIAIKSALDFVLRRFRDFEEGMRIVDVERFKEIKNKIRDITDTTLRELYYGLGSFYRVNASIPELIKIIEMGAKLSESGGVKLTKFDDDSFLVGIASREKVLPYALRVLRMYKVLVNSVQISNFELLLLKCEKPRGKLRPSELKSISTRLIKLL